MVRLHERVLLFSFDIIMWRMKHLEEEKKNETFKNQSGD